MITAAPSTSFRNGADDARLLGSCLCRSNLVLPGCLSLAENCKIVEAHEAMTDIDAQIDAALPCGCPLGDRYPYMTDEHSPSCPVRSRPAIKALFAGMKEELAAEHERVGLLGDEIVRLCKDADNDLDRSNKIEAERDAAREALADLVEIERRDNLTNPTMTATDWFREQAWDRARKALSDTPAPGVGKGVLGTSDLLASLIGADEASIARGEKCPRCNSPDPKRHPAMQFEGEVQICQHPWHGTQQPTDRDAISICRNPECPLLSEGTIHGHLKSQPTDRDAVLPTEAQLATAMQEAWDDFTSDTNCFPECFSITRGPKLWADFRKSNFVSMVRMYLSGALKSQPKQEG